MTMRFPEPAGVGTHEPERSGTVKVHFPRQAKETST